MIKNRHYRALELDKVLQLLSREASCSESQERILSMEPSTGLYEVNLLLQETDDAHMLTGRFGSPSFGGLQNVANSLRRAQAGASLSMGELLKVAEVLRVMRGLTQWRKRSEGLETSIDWRFEALTPNKYLEEKIAYVLATNNKFQIMKDDMGYLKGKADGKLINQEVADICK